MWEVFVRLSLAFIFLVFFGAAAYAQARSPVTIQGKILSVRDRLPPDELRGIVVEAGFKFTLSGANNVEESWSRVAVRNERAPQLNLSGPDQTAKSSLGESGARLSWRVQGEHSLERISAGKQYIFMMNIEIDKNKNCHLSARMLLQKGATFSVARRFDNGEDARFTLPHILSATCSIE
jgi:hypothetical protein